MAVSFENILYEVEDGILTITLNRPEILNAFSGGMLRDITEAFDRADADDDVPVSYTHLTLPTKA